MRHFLALDLQLQIGLLLRADIDRHADDFEKISVLVLQTSAAHDDPAGLAVMEERAGAPISKFRLSTGVIESRMNGGAFIRMHA